MWSHNIFNQCIFEITLTRAVISDPGEIVSAFITQAMFVLLINILIYTVSDDGVSLILSLDSYLY